MQAQNQDTQSIVRKDVRVVVLCSNSEGAPEFHTCAVLVTPEEQGEGKHYILAVEDAEKNGYDEPMIPFDATDPASKQLFALHELGISEMNIPEENSELMGGISIRQKAMNADIASRFIQELLDSMETLTGCADQYGSQTLADLMYLQQAILTGSMIEFYNSGGSVVLDIASSLPSGEKWVKYIKIAREGHE